MKDYVGNSKSVFSPLGATNHSDTDREDNDYYATPPEAVEMLLERESFIGDIWEPACGEGHISKVLERHGYNVLSSDLVNRGYGNLSVDFLSINEKYIKYMVNIITNPPYKFAKEFVLKALEIIPDGYKIAMFLKLTFLESKSRRELFDKYPPKVLYVSSSRLECAKNGNFKKSGTTAIAYGWYVWEKGFKGEPVIRWFN
jgi:hypothetical protein